MTAAIRFQNVSKRYRLRQQKPYLARQVLQMLTQRPAEVAEHWAMRDVSFEISPGESVGVIGRNGAGKSTMLSLMAQTGYPTLGSVEVEGRVGPLLELGAGFHPDLTGVENIFLNGLLLGLSRQQVADRFDSIAAYADIGKFLDSPLHTYSTGMRARLGFSVVAHIDADIILLDEILGVGDQNFRTKSERTLTEFRASGSTLVLVSHSPVAVQRLCDRALWIEAGHLQMDGPCDEVLAAYSEHLAKSPVVPPG